MPTPVQCALPVRERASGSAPHSQSRTQGDRSSAFLDIELPVCRVLDVHIQPLDRGRVGMPPLFLNCHGSEVTHFISVPISLMILWDTGRPGSQVCGLLLPRNTVLWKGE